MTDIPITYLASAYSAPDHIDDVESYLTERAHEAEDAFQYLQTTGVGIYYSPIATWHHIAKRKQLPTAAADFISINTMWLSAATEIVVLKNHGWFTSKGVIQEIKTARLLNLPVRYLHLTNNNMYRFLSHAYI